MIDRKKFFEQYLIEYCHDASEPLRYALLSGGHRIRPLLTMCWCELAGGTVEQALPFALSVELVHTMSLIHDDLPCMDNAYTRRGKASLHNQYGEANALLIGDELLARGFELIADTPAAIKELSRASIHMATGQRIELSDKVLEYCDWLNIHEHKTASLIRAACVLGVIAARGNDDFIQRAATYGTSLGLAYQIMDDIRDNDGIVSIIGQIKAKEVAISYTLDGCSVPGLSDASHVLRSVLQAVIE